VVEILGREQHCLIMAAVHCATVQRSLGNILMVNIVTVMDIMLGLDVSLAVLIQTYKMSLMLHAYKCQVYKESFIFRMNTT